MEWTGSYSLNLIPATPEEMAAVTGEVLKETPPGDPPAPPPPHKITLCNEGALPYIVYETEHGKQIVGNLCYSGEVIRFTALAGSPGDELFIYAVKLENGILTGEAYQTGMAHSKLTGKLLPE